VLILGINHQIQWVQIWSYSSGGELERFEASQKDQFRELLRRRIAERRVQFIGEETKHGEPSIAHEVCASAECRYANIEMHPDERALRKIPTNYESDPNVPPEQKASFHQQREEYMLEQAVTGAADAESIIVICGRYHTPGLASRLREAGHQVDEADIQGEPWYVEDWMEHMMRM
jgi:hypothetical protein